ISASLLAGRSLYEHVANVAQALEEQGLEGGRKAVALLVGRDPDNLDEAGVARAAIESLAENFSDGIVAPLFWGIVFGLPGIALYKAANTADSMIGHRSERYEYFGKCAARLDDILNFLPARHSGEFLSASASTFIHKLKARSLMLRDARKHLSMNAGWPEAGMAGALEVRLGGPRCYGNIQVEGAWLGDGRDDLDASDIRRALRIYVRAGIFCASISGLASAIWIGMVFLGQN
ncbi:MAG: adenosylcobinamide-phosphate synthase CbiB, partial [Parvibaculaceae bacterium]|nr:adenosylcobinamide-phosphate synthase CbiB [Parvibaculaceae bacterium]